MAEITKTAGITGTDETIDVKHELAFEVRHNNTLIAVGGSVKNVQMGSNFFGNGSEMLQWGTMRYDEGRILQPHVHHRVNRQGKYRTHEFLFVVQGKLGATFYTLDKKFIISKVLEAGDYVCLYSGGHGFRVLEDDTMFFEVKHGPFIGIEQDKEKF